MNLLKKLIVILILIAIIAAVVVGAIGYNYYQEVLDEQSTESRIAEIRDGVNFTSYADLADDYINAVVAVEDHRFFEHGAIDIISIGRAIYTNISSQELQEGGSTITQQVAKNVFFTQEETIKRKSAEFFAAVDLEKMYTKVEIFELYVNTAYFGDGYYGIKEASLGYYDKLPSELTLSEASMLAGVPNAPSVYAPTKNPDLASERQQQVLKRMVKYDYITQEQADEI